MDSPFTSVWDLFDWSYRHVCSVEALVSDYVSRAPYELVCEPDPEAEGFIHKARVTKSLPLDISLHTFDAVNSQRAALDQAIYASGLVLLGRAPKGTKFPFGFDEADARRNGLHKSETHPLIVEAALKSEPFDVGERLLRKLNLVRNMKHHRILAPTALRTRSMVISGANLRGSGALPAMTIGNFQPWLRQEAQRPDWDAEKGELTLFRTATPERSGRIDIEVTVTFGDDTPFVGERAVGTLLATGRKAQGAIEAIEIETIRLASL